MKKRLQDRGTPGSKILFIGDCPVDGDKTTMFENAGADIITSILYSLNLTWNDCYATNLVNIKPVKGQFSEIIREHPSEITSGLARIHQYIALHKPAVIISLGHFAKYHLTGEHNLDRTRGYFTRHIGSNTLLLPTYNPNDILYGTTELAIFDLDVKKAISTILSPSEPMTQKEFHICTDPSDVDLARNVIMSCKHVAVDIETTMQGDLLCVGFAISPHVAYVFPYQDSTMQTIMDILANEEVKKIFHNGTFDITTLELLYQIPVMGYTEDTLIQSHVIAPEMPRSLEFLVSIFSNAPYYKQSGRGAIPEDTKVWGKKADKSAVYIYNAKDCIYTFEIWLAMKKIIEQDEDFKHTYRFEMESCLMAIDMGKNGLYVDEERVNAIKQPIEKRMELLSFMINQFVGTPMNISSSQQLCTFLYDILRLPPKMKYTKKNQQVRTADKDAIAALVAFAKGKKNEAKMQNTKQHWDNILFILRSLIEYKMLAKLVSSYLNIKLLNGYAVCQYKVGGTETGRWGCQAFFDYGLNEQTFPRGSVTVS